MERYTNYFYFKLSNEFSINSTSEKPCETITEYVHGYSSSFERSQKLGTNKKERKRKKKEPVSEFESFDKTGGG